MTIPACNAQQPHCSLRTPGRFAREPGETTCITRRPCRGDDRRTGGEEVLEGIIRARVDSLSVELEHDGAKWHARLGGHPVHITLQGRLGLGFLRVPLKVHGLLDDDGDHAALHIREVTLPAGIHGSFGTSWAAKWLAGKLRSFGVKVASEGNAVHFQETIFSGESFSLSWRGKSPTETWLERFAEYARTEAGQAEVRERFPSFMGRFGEMLGEARHKATGLFGALSDPQVPAALKIAIAAGLIYLVMPADAVPDWLGQAGLIDDVSVLHLVYGQVSRVMQTRREGQTQTS